MSQNPRFSAERSFASPTEWPQVFASVPWEAHPSLRETNRLLRAEDIRPNILLVFTDQQTADAMSCAGNRWVRTPFMDSLAQRGVRFTRSYCTAPICTPARASLMTGRAAHETGADYLNQAPHAELPNLGEVLQAAGYDTTYIGKWHLPESYPKSCDAIPGFHYLPRPADLLGAHLGDAADMHDAMRAAHYLRWHAGLSPKPWMLTVSLHNPHDICHHCMAGDDLVHMSEPEPSAGLFGQGVPPLPENFKADPDEPELLQERRKQTRYAREMGLHGEWSEARWRAYLQTYYHLTQSVDRCLQPIIAGLQAGGWGDNTLVIFTSDHGEGIAAHEWMTKLSLYEESVGVPLIAIPPGGWKTPLTRADSAHLVSGMDLMPTLLDYAGVGEAERPPQTGQSLRPLIEGVDTANWRDFLVIEIALDPSRPRDHGRMILSSDGWKYCVWSRGERREQLFNLKEDSGETRNLITDPAANGHAIRLRQALAEWACATEDPFSAAM